MCTRGEMDDNGFDGKYHVMEKRGFSQMQRPRA